MGAAVYTHNHPPDRLRSRGKGEVGIGKRGHVSFRKGFGRKVAFRAVF